MFSFNQVMIVMLFVVVIALLSVFLGGWLMFKGRNAAQGENLIGGAPKGTVFTIPDAAEEISEESIIDRTKDFLKMFEGGK